jgi:hypothetical protein
VKEIKSMESEILKNDVFPIVLNRITERKDSLVPMGRFLASGLEGWFKVEVVRALANTKYSIKEIRGSNSGRADLLLEDGIEIELKGQTNFVPSEIRVGLKYGTPCLFLADGSNKSTIRKLESDKDVEMICYETFSDGPNEWIIGLIRPRNSSIH